MTTTARPDVLVHGGGTTFLFDPVSDRGREWSEAHIGYEPWQTFGGAIAVSHRYIEDLVYEARNAGLVVE